MGNAVGRRLDIVRKGGGRQEFDGAAPSVAPTQREFHGGS